MDVCGRGRGSSNVTDCLPPEFGFGEPSIGPAIDFLLSFLLIPMPSFESFVGSAAGCCCSCCRSSSPERRMRIGSFIRDFFGAMVLSMVGAVVMMAGAKQYVHVSSGSYRSMRNLALFQEIIRWLTGRLVSMRVEQPCHLQARLTSCEQQRACALCCNNSDTKFTFLQWPHAKQRK